MLNLSCSGGLKDLQTWVSVESQLGKENSPVKNSMRRCVLDIYSCVYIYIVK